MIQFNLPNVTLYSKGWYKKTNIVSDLNRCVSNDRYLDCERNANTIFEIILFNLKETGFFNEGHNLETFIINVDPKNTWKVNYFTKETLFGSNDDEYDYYTACLYAIISLIGNLHKDNVVLNEPPSESVLQFKREDCLHQWKEINNIQ